MIQAGAKLRLLLNPWDSTDCALKRIAERFPEHDLEACLVKTATLNALYNTNVYAVWRMGEHVHRVLNDPECSTGPELVDRLARMDQSREHRSFASKFAHFFLDPDQYPILDQYVVKMMAWHLGNHRVWPKCYVEFYNWFQSIKGLCDEDYSNKALDQYLWMAGMYHEFQANGRKRLSGSAAELFERRDREVLEAIKDLMSSA